MIGHPVDLIQLSDRTPDGDERMDCVRDAIPIQAAFVSASAATTAKHGTSSRELQLRKDFLNWDIGYPESIQLADGSVLNAIIFYNLFNKYFIGGTFWKP